MFWIGLGIGSLIGAVIGIFALCVLICSKNACEKYTDELEKENEDFNEMSKMRR